MRKVFILRKLIISQSASSLQVVQDENLSKLKIQDAQMMNIIENLHEKESVISELHTKIRTLENDTPKSSPETYGNGEERKNLSEPKRHRTGFDLHLLPDDFQNGLRWI